MDFAVDMPALTLRHGSGRTNALPEAGAGSREYYVAVIAGGPVGPRQVGARQVDAQVGGPCPAAPSQPITADERAPLIPPGRAALFGANKSVSVPPPGGPVGRASAELIRWMQCVATTGDTGDELSPVFWRAPVALPDGAARVVRLRLKRYRNTTSSGSRPPDTQDILGSVRIRTYEN